MLRPGSLKKPLCDAGAHGRQAALNTDSVARLGAYGGPRLERLWVQTHTERLYLWDWEAACNEGAEGGPAPGLGCAGDAWVCTHLRGAAGDEGTDIITTLQSGWVRAMAHAVQMRVLDSLRTTFAKKGLLMETSVPFAGPGSMCVSVKRLGVTCTQSLPANLTSSGARAQVARGRWRRWRMCASS